MVSCWINVINVSARLRRTENIPPQKNIKCYNELRFDKSAVSMKQSAMPITTEKRNFENGNLSV